jgi:hypothetical protein
MSEDRCTQCGASIRNGRDGCQNAWDKIAMESYSQPGYGAVRELAFDTYCMQHLEKYCRSAKSYAAHLTRLCCGLEYGGSAAVYAAIRQWLDGSVDIEKPAPPQHRGQMTITDVCAATSAMEHVAAVKAWAENVWKAYTDQHEVARQWIEAALDARHSSKAAQK